MGYKKKIIKPLLELSHDTLDFLFPRYCLGCSDKLLRKEKHLCTPCFYRLPFNNSHIQLENDTELRLRGRFPFENATSLLHFEKEGITQKLIHAIKYKKEENAGRYLGNMFGEKLCENPQFRDIDIIIPVPIHKMKERERGYNQSQVIAEGIASKLGIPVKKNILVKKKNTRSQTLHSGHERWENVKKSFSIQNPEQLVNKHVLLVDDVLTTGSTLDACAVEILQIQDVKISIATLAIAEN